MPFFFVPVKIEWEDPADGAMDSSLATRFVVCFTVALWVALNPKGVVVGPVGSLTPTTSHNRGINRVGQRCGLFGSKSPRGQERETIEFLLDGDTEVQRKLEIGS